MKKKIGRSSPDDLPQYMSEFYTSICSAMLSGGGIGQFDRAIRAAPTGRRSYWSHNGCNVCAGGWRRLGAQMVMLYPMYRLPTFDEQIETLQRFMNAVEG